MPPSDATLREGPSLRCHIWPLQRRRRLDDALLYVSCISKQPGHFCHFQLHEPYTVVAPNVLWYVFMEFPFSITAVSANALTIRKYSQHTDVLYRCIRQQWPYIEGIRSVLCVCVTCRVTWDKTIISQYIHIYLKKGFFIFRTIPGLHMNARLVVGMSGLLLLSKWSRRNCLTSTRLLRST